MRAVSTVVDVTVCLLLVSAAVGTLLVAEPTPVEPTADETAEQLATTTANVSDSGGGADRRAFGTHAELLARAAVANLSLSGESLAPTTDRFRAAVRRRVGRLLDRAPARTEVTARWWPYPDAPIRGELTVGPSPPARATVSTARLTVPLPLRSDWNASAGSYDALARSLSAAILGHALPETARPIGQSDRIGDRTGAYDRALGGASAGARRRGLAARLASDMRDRFDGPRAAAAALRPDTVRIVVREWEA